MTANPPAAQPAAFDGLASSTTEPPSSYVAAGPEHIIQAADGKVRITTRTGTELGILTFEEFFGISTIPNYDAEVFDARVIFDAVKRRWVAIEGSFDCYAGNGATVGTGYLDIALSATTDPMGVWEVISIPYPDQVPDFPGLGNTLDKVVATANVHDLLNGGGLYGCHAGALDGVEIDVMAWSQLLGTGNLEIDVFYITNDYPHAVFNMLPTNQQTAWSDTAFIAGMNTSFGGVMTIGRISGSPATNNTGWTVGGDPHRVDIGEGFYVPPPPQQPGSPATIANGVYQGPTAVAYHQDRLVVVSTQPCDPAGGIVELRDCVRVTDIDPAPVDGDLIEDTLFSEEGADLYMPGIAFTLTGDLHVVWTRSSETGSGFPSTYGSYQMSTEAADEWSVPGLVRAGTGVYAGTEWGQYVGVATDPQVPNAVWQGAAYSTASGAWATHVSELQTNGASYVPITPQRVLDSRPASQIGQSGPFPSNQPLDWQVAGVGAIPLNAIAVTGNFVVVGQTAAGYAAVTPDRVENPSTSSINFPVGDTRTNAVTVPLSTFGKLWGVFKAPAGKSTYFIFDVTGYYLSGSSEASYATVSPVRVLDSRPGGTGLSGAFAPNVPRKLTIAGTHGIPADAVAITGNLTVVGQTRAGYLSITKVSDSTPDTSTINFPIGDTRANGLSVPLNASGALWIVYKASGGSTHVLLDVTGYYRNDPSGMLFYPLTPGRIMDTRAGSILSGVTGSFPANTPRRLDVSGHWGAPAGANAITGNLTVVNQTAAGYVSATLNSEINPTTSILNFPLADTRANGVTMPLNSGGRSWFVYKAAAGRTTHLILDISGYFD